jgi:hypothetical protein
MESVGTFVTAFWTTMIVSLVVADFAERPEEQNLMEFPEAP